MKNEPKLEKELSLVDPLLSVKVCKIFQFLKHRIETNVSYVQDDETIPALRASEAVRWLLYYYNIYVTPILNPERTIVDQPEGEMYFSKWKVMIVNIYMTENIYDTASSRSWPTYDEALTKGIEIAARLIRRKYAYTP